MDRDLEHVRLLSIFYYVFSGLAVLGSCCGLFYIAIGLAMAADPKFFPQPHGQQAPPEFMRFIMAPIGGFIFVAAWIMAALTFFAARALSKRKWYVFILIVAGLICMSFPF